MFLRYVSGLSALVLVFGFSLSAEAKPSAKTKREKNQEYRIKKGVKSGKLTQKERVKIAKEQKKIDAYERKIASDGKVTKREHLRLDRKRDRASRSIYKQKHDKQNAKWAKKKKAPVNEAAGAKARKQREISSDAQALVMDP
jgi:hypothetical protein